MSCLCWLACCIVVPGECKTFVCAPLFNYLFCDNARKHAYWAMRRKLNINDWLYCSCHESGSWPSVRLPEEVTSPSYWLSHHTDCYISLWTTVPTIHCTDYTHTAGCSDCTQTAECTDYTYTAESNQTRFISPGLYLSHSWVLFSEYHSSSDSYIMEPFQVSGSSLILVISCCLVVWFLIICLCILD